MLKVPEYVLGLGRPEIEEMIDKYVIFKRHSERNRAILKRSMLDGICYEPLAEEFGLSPRQVSDIVRDAKKQLFAHFK